MLVKDFSPTFQLKWGDFIIGEVYSFKNRIIVDKLGQIL